MQLQQPPSVITIVKIGLLSSEEHPKLGISILKIYVKNIGFKDRKDQCFYAMKMSSRGDIRRSPNSCSWVQSLIKLNKVGHDDPAAVVKSWNHQAAKSDKLIGQKAQSVKNVLELPPSVRGLVLKAVSDYGWDSHVPNWVSALFYGHGSSECACCVPGAWISLMWCVCVCFLRIGSCLPQMVAHTRIDAYSVSHIPTLKAARSQMRI